jgi:Tfp pilus assembly protein PilF
MSKIANLLLAVVIVLGGLYVEATYAETEAPAVKTSSETVRQDRNSVTGFVFNESRAPLADVHVELLSDLGTTLSRTKTNGSGLYYFRGLTSGQYNVKVSYYGTDYESQTRSVNLVGFSVIPGSGSVSEQLDFYLRPRKKSANVGPLAAPGVIFAQEIAEEAKKLYEAGIEDLSNKKEKEGFEKLKRAIELAPNYFSALDRLGTEYVVRGYYTPAYVLLTKALEVNPRSFSSNYGLGLSLYRLQQYDKAVESLQRATEIYNKSPSAYLWLGTSLLQNKKLPQAETALIEANKLSKGTSAEVHWQLARLYMDQKRFRESADELELFLKYKPKVEDEEKIKQTIATLRQKAAGN